MTAINYRTADVDGFEHLLSRGGRARRAEAAAAARLPDLRPHVPRPDPAARRPLPHRRARSAGLRPVRHAGPKANTFDHIADTIDRFTEIVGFDRYAVYVFDYGAPTGFRLAVKHPDRITAIISQNGNAYEEGLSDGWNPIRAYWQDRVAGQSRGAARLPHARDDRLAIYARRSRPDDGVAGRILARQLLSGAARRADVQLDLFGDYKSNVALYPTFQKYFRTHKPPFLAVWGKNDPFFLPPGAEAFKRDIPNAIVRFFDTGHFALETHATEIAAAIRDFLPG